MPARGEPCASPSPRSGDLTAPEAPAARPSPSIRVRPHVVSVDRAGGLQRLSCDFEISNPGDDVLDMTGIVGKAFSAGGMLVAWNKVDNNGARPSVDVLARRHIDPKGTITVFNPFLFDAAVPIARVTYEFRLRGSGDDARTASREPRESRRRPVRAGRRRSRRDLRDPAASEVASGLPGPARRKP